MSLHLVTSLPPFSWFLFNLGRISAPRPSFTKNLRERTSGKGNNESSFGIKKDSLGRRPSVPGEALLVAGSAGKAPMSPGIASLQSQALTSRCFLQREAHSWISKTAPIAPCTSEVKARGQVRVGKKHCKALAVCLRGPFSWCPYETPQA